MPIFDVNVVEEAIIPGRQWLDTGQYIDNYCCNAAIL